MVPLRSRLSNPNRLAQLATQALEELMVLHLAMDAQLLVVVHVSYAATRPPMPEESKGE